MKHAMQLFIDRPMMSFLTTALMVIAGVLTAFQLHREAFPNVDYDMVIVVSMWPGASPSEVEKLVTNPIEKQIKSVDGLKTVKSTTIEGRSVIVITVDPDWDDKSGVVNDIQNAVDKVRDLPEDVERPYVDDLSSTGNPIITYSIAAEFSEAELRRLAKRLETRLMDVKGVSDVLLAGYRDSEFHVKMDPEKLERLDLSVDAVVKAVRERNINVPGGSLYKGDHELLIRTVGEVTTPKEIEEIVVRSNDQGNWIRIGEIGEVTQAYDRTQRLMRQEGESAIQLSVVRRPSSDIIEVVEGTQKEVEAFRELLPEGVKVVAMNDLSVFVERRLNVLLSNGIFGFVLVIIALFLFLNPTVALVAAFGIPFSFAGTLFMMDAFGVTINLITMIGMIAVLGILVDDAIVVAENIYRYLEQGLSPRDAAIKGVGEVVLPVTATILTNVFAFIPLLLMTGIFGKFMWGMPVVVILALLFSWFESFFLLPSHIREFVTFSRWFQRKPRQVAPKPWFQKFQNKYLQLVTFCLNNRKKSVFAMIMVMAGAGVLYKYKMKFILFSSVGVELFVIQVEAPPETDRNKMVDYLIPIEELAATLPENELDTYATYTGILQENPDDPNTRRGSNYGQVVVFLTPTTERERSADEIISALREKYKPPSHLIVNYRRPNPGPPVGVPVDVQIKGDDFEPLMVVAEKYMAYLKERPGVYDVRHSLYPGKDELTVSVDEKAASRAGLSVQSISRAVRAAFDGVVATKVKTLDEEIDVKVIFADGYRHRENALEELMISNQFGNKVRLSTVASIQRNKAFASLRHVDFKRVVSVSANIDTAVTTSQEVNEDLERDFESIGQDHPTIQVSYEGEWKDTQESMDSLFRAFALASLLIWFTLAVLLNNLFHPLLVMFAIPFGMTGAIYSSYAHTFFLEGMDPGFMMLLGCIGMAGVVVNDSIVLVFFIFQRRQQGVAAMDAIRQACEHRLRPVVLTTITTVCGLLPTCYGVLGFDPFVRPVVMAMAYGLLFSTFLTLVMIPCLYAIVEDMGESLKRRFKLSESPA